MNIEKISKLIDKYDVISFDIFDTLLIRPYIKPNDLFKHMELYSNSIGFAKAREEAEYKARCNKNKDDEDITIDDIYNNIKDDFKNLKNLEIDFETNLLKINKEIFEIYNIALSKNKDIYIISDMYLSSKILNTILFKNGYKNFKKIYVSSETKKTKHTGSMYKLFLDENNLRPQQVLHIGDSLIADIKSAKKYNINTFYYPKLQEQFFKIKENKVYKDLYTLSQNSLDISIYLSLLIEKWNNNRTYYKNIKTDEKIYWEKIGYELGGILCYGFSKFILDISKQNNFKNLFFIARDGFILKKVFDLFNEKNIKTYYLYAQRMLKIKCLKTYDKETIDINLKILKNEYNNLNLNYPNNLNSYEDKENFIKSNDKIINQIADRTKKEYTSYFNDLVKNDKVENFVLVDSSTGKFSAQKLLSYVLNKEITGIYLEANSEYGEKHKIRNFKYRKDEKIGAITGLLEFLMQSPEPPVEDIKDFKPVYQENPHEAEIRRNYIYNFVIKGIVDFSNDIIARLNQFQIPISLSSINNIILYYETNMKKLDKKMFSTIFCVTTNDHTGYNDSLLKLINMYRDKNLKDIFYILSIKFLSITYYEYFKLIKLFDFIPIIYIKNNNIKLFKFIPLIKINKCETTKKYYLFNFIRIFKIKSKFN